MWRYFMEVMVTLAAIGIVIAGVVVMLLGLSTNEYGDSLVAWGVGGGILIIVIGFTVIGTTGMIVEGVGYLKIIAGATQNGQIQFVANPNMQNVNYNGMQQNANPNMQNANYNGMQQNANPNMQNENYSGMQQNAYTQVCGQVFQQSAVNTDKEVSNEDGLEILKEAADSATATKEGWTCSECGEKNRTNYLYCKYCGTHK